MKQNRSKRRKRSKRRSYGGLFRMGAITNTPVEYVEGEASANERAERRKNMIIFEDPAGGAYYDNAVGIYRDFPFTTENRACNELQGYQQLACSRFNTYESESKKLRPDMYLLEQSLAEFICYSYLVQDNASTMPAIYWLYHQMTKIATRYPSSKPSWGESVFDTIRHKLNKSSETTSKFFRKQMTTKELKQLVGIPSIGGRSKRRTRRR